MIKEMVNDLFLIEFENRKKLLYEFSIYIASDPDFKYNQTYLTDQIDSFVYDSKKIIEKRNVFNDMVTYIKLMNVNSNNVRVLLDESFFYSSIDGEDNDIVNIPLLKKEGIVLKLVAVDVDVEYLYTINRNCKNKYEWKSIVDKFFGIVDCQVELMKTINNEK